MGTVAPADPVVQEHGTNGGQETYRAALSRKVTLLARLLSTTLTRVDRLDRTQRKQHQLIFTLLSRIGQLEHQQRRRLEVTARRFRTSAGATDGIAKGRGKGNRAPTHNGTVASPVSAGHKSR